MPDTMILRVEKAIRDELGLDWPTTGNDGLVDVARAAIKAMREPTGAMERAGDDYEIERVIGNDGTGVVTVGSTASTLWNAMLDAALAEEG